MEGNILLEGLILGSFILGLMNIIALLGIYNVYLDHKFGNR